jgi:hypothetical protein
LGALRWCLPIVADRSAAEGEDGIRHSGGMRVATARRFGDWGRLWLLALCFVAPATIASQIIPAGGKAILHDGFYNLGCTDLTIGGTLDLGTGTYVNVRNVTVASSGLIQGTGAIRYSGKLSVSGVVQPGVQLIVNLPTNVDCPGPPATGPGKVVNPAPTLGSSMLVALATLVLLLALFALRGQAASRRSSEEDGANE